MTDARARLLRDLQGSGRPLSEVVMPEDWPVLAGEQCVLRVLDEDDAQHWRTHEGITLFAGPQMYHGGLPAPAQIASDGIRACRVAWALGGGRRLFGIWTVPGRRLAGAVQLTSGQVAMLAWVVFREHRSVDLIAEALTLASRWALENLDSDAVLVRRSDRDAADIEAVEAAGFVHDGPAVVSGPRSSWYRFPPAPPLTPEP